ncbi:MAG: CocE/NonD family hydrolase [Pyrinomonadaceae bacterium]|nr:CocE/NonD family hydrolase [Blastocatellia bacterium]MCW5957639.1 CocE/NonD family hydrolase [Pyrinomonadaceae bacterium]
MRTRSFIIGIFAVLLTTSAIAQQLTVQTELGEYIKANYTKREVMVPVRDGVKLFTSIYEPKDKSKTYPILLNRTPYTVAPYGEQMKTSLGPDALFAREGYIFVYQDVRGRWMSEGKFEDVRPDIENRTPQQIDESTDTYDTIEWLIKNVENNNGKVGTYGISYPGFYTSAGSIDSHPALKACSPQAPVSDWFHGDDMHHNGALFLAQNYSFFQGFGQDRPQPTNNGSYMKPWNGRNTQDGYDLYLQLGGLKETADYYQTALGTRIKFWDDMMAHPNYDQFWKDRNILTKLKNVKCATMTVGGWYDNEDLYGALRTYEYIEKQNPGTFNVLVVGPWDHGGWSRNDGDWLGTAYFTQKTGEYYRKNLEVPFFNYFLKGTGDISAIKEVNLFDTGSHEWRSFDTYEPTTGKDTALYIAANGTLSFTKPASAGSDEYVSDPMNPVPYTQKITRNYPRDFMTEDQRFASTRPDVLVYKTEPLKEDVTVAGDIKPSLYVSSSGTDSDFVVKLIDVFPDDYRFPAGVFPPQSSAWSVFQPGGYQMLLRGEPMPARFRSSFEKPEALVPNQPTYLPFKMPGVVHTFKKGHRIMVQIQSTWFPLVARNPQKYVPNYKQASQADFQKATQRIYRGGKYASAIIVSLQK